MKTGGITLRPIGYVRSSVTDPKDLPFEGVPAQIEILERWEEALDGIENYSHIIVLGHLNGAEPRSLKVHPMGISSLPEVGLLASRSPHRPNPITVTVTRLLRRKSRTLSVDPLDLIDGTPVVDIKPYHPSTDSVFGATTPDRFNLFRFIPEEELLRHLVIEASRFHGEACAGLAIGVRIAWRAMKELACDLRSREVEVLSKAGGCMTDAVQALTGANSKRLRRSDELDGTIAINKGDRKLAFAIGQDRRFRKVEEVLRARDEEIFTLHMK